MEAALRLGAFVAVFALTALLEMTLPRRPRGPGAGRRWAINLGLLLVDVVAQRLTVGAAAFAAALWAEDLGFGLLRRLGVPPLVAGVVGFVLLDLAIWLQHLVTHKVPILWRVHQVHHADLDVDLTTGLRFHPLEILLSMLCKAAVVVLLGVDPWVVILLEAVLNGATVLTHGNIGLPERLDRGLRWVVCTPDMRRVHHSTLRAEHDSNYGFFLSVWDRAFGTMRHAPAAGQLGVELGLAGHRDAARLGLVSLLAMPLRPPPPVGEGPRPGAATRPPRPVGRGGGALEPR